jgi:hypothetical protein
MEDGEKVGPWKPWCEQDFGVSVSTDRGCYVKRKLFLATRSQTRRVLDQQLESRPALHSILPKSGVLIAGFSRYILYTVPPLSPLNDEHSQDSASISEVTPGLARE